MIIPLESAKNYLKVEADVLAEDALITRMINAAFAYIEKETNIFVLEAEVTDLIVKDSFVKGVIANDKEVLAKKTILTTGTFLNGLMYTGSEVTKGGRVGDDSAIPLSKKLYDLKLPMGRLKTGTPARITMSSLNLSVMEEQPGEKPTPFMSLTNQVNKHQQQLSCYIARTNKKTHKIISENTHLSAMYSGNISVRKVLRETSKATATCVGFSSLSKEMSMVAKP